MKKGCHSVCCSLLFLYFTGNGVSCEIKKLRVDAHSREAVIVANDRAWRENVRSTFYLVIEGETGMKKLMKKFLCVLAFCFMFSAFVSVPAVEAKDVVIVLDPGHGRSELGAYRKWSGVTYREDVLNLKIANYVKKELETYAGVKVYLTHNSLTGKTMDREQRLKVAKKKKASALVSIHINSTADKKTYKSTGAFAVVPSVKNYPNSKSYAKKARALGKTILKELNSQVGLKNNGYWIDDELGIILFGMKYKIPSIIVEHCFINNPNDCKKYLKTETQLKKMAVADAVGIARYFKLSKKDGAWEEEETKPVKNGWYTVDGQRYYYKNGVKYKNGWKKISGKYYYFNKSGVLQKGVFKIGGKLYLSNAKGVRQKGFVTYAGKKYYADNKGKLYTGWQEYKGQKYYFGKVKGAAVTGLVKIGKYKYYFNKKTGVRRTKWVTIASKGKYFFNEKNGRMLKKEWLLWNGKWYYLGPDGKAFVSTRKKIDNKWYKFNSKGICTNRK